jgi:septal ring factor EnvC (AmiA/AmiB activator)
MPLVSKTEAAKLAGVSRQTIHRKIASGELSATDGQIDTSELIRVFGSIRDESDASQPVSRPSQSNSNVQVQLQARIDTLETELAVTREQLRDTATDRDEWREMAKSANENVKLLTDQSSKGGDTNNNVILIAIAALIGVVLLVLGLTGNLGGSQRQEQPKQATEQLTDAGGEYDVNGDGNVDPTE